MKVSQLNDSLANMSRTCEDIKLKVYRIRKDKDKEGPTMKEKSIKNLEADILLQCKVCDYNSVTDIQIKKRINIKHNKSLKCNKCDKKCDSNAILTKHTEESHYDGFQITGVPEFSLCEDTFSTDMEYEEHVNTHLEEINDIDTEDFCT